MKQRDASKPRSASPILTRRQHAVPKPASARNIRATHKRVSQKREAAPSAPQSHSSGQSDRATSPQSLPSVAVPVQQPAQPASAGSQPDSSPQHKTPLTPQQFQEGLQKHQRTRVVPSGQTRASASTPRLTLIVLAGAPSISASPSNQNMVRSIPQLQPVSPTTQKKISATSAISTGSRECRSITSRL